MLPGSDSPPEHDASSDDFFDRTQPLLAAQPDLAAEVARAACERSRSAGDQAGVVRALLLLGMAHDALGRSERDEVLAEALRLAELVADPVLLIRAVTSQTVVDIYQGRYAEALARGRSMLGMAHVLRRDDLLLRLLNNLAIALNLIGEFDLAIGMFDECLRLLRGDTADSRIHRARTINNQAMAWLGIAKLARFRDATAGMRALDKAAALAEAACTQMLAEDHLSLRLSTLDTLAGVLLQRGDADTAMQWVQRVAEVSGDKLAEGSSMHWGTFALVLSRVELARPDVDTVSVLARLRLVEALPGPRFRGGEMQAILNLCLADALERTGAHADALKYHRSWLQFEARTQSLLVREHAMAVHHTLDSLRGETEEFITHDLRNPLGAALVQMDSVTEKALLDPTAQASLCVARSGVQLAFDTADHYLAIVRTRNLRRATLARLDLAELVDDVGERLAPPAGARVRLERELEWGLEIRGDRILLLTALHYLLRSTLAQAAAGCQVSWRLRAEPGYANLTAVNPCADQRTVTDWYRSLAADGAAMGSGRELGATMIARVAQLHDSVIEPRVDAQSGASVEWRFPLIGA